MLFKDRREAGRQVAALLKEYRNHPKTVVLGLPRGGVVTAQEIAAALDLPLDIIVARKIGAPGNPEFAIGAVDEEGEGFFNDAVIAEYGIDRAYLDREIVKAKNEARRRLSLYRGKRPALDLRGKIAILIDDGVATGATMRAAIQSAKRKEAAKVIVAVPVIARDTLEKLKAESDEVLYLAAPDSFMAVGQFYENFEQTDDETVVAIMR